MTRQQYIHSLFTANLFVLEFVCTRVLGKTLLSAVFMHLTWVCYLILRCIYWSSAVASAHKYFYFTQEYVSQPFK